MIGPSPTQLQEFLDVIWQEVSSRNTYFDMVLLECIYQNYPSYYRYPRKTVMIVEDNSDMQDFYKLLLSKNCWDIRNQSVYGKEALMYYRNTHVKLGVVILDYELPDCVGFDVANWILEINQQQKIVFVTANHDLTIKRFRLNCCARGGERKNLITGDN